jgi:PAS domain S-box-containing protein
LFKTPDTFSRPILSGVTLFIALSLGVIIFSNLQDKQKDRRIAELLKRETAAVSALIEADLDSRVRSTQRLTNRWIVNKGTSKNAFLSDALGYIVDQPGYQAMEWVDKDFYVRWLVPLEGNEKAVGLNLAKEDRRRKALEIARDKKSMTLSQPIKLVQGGTGFLAYFPIFIDDKFDGFILSVFSIERWLAQVLHTRKLDILSDDESLFHVRLSIGGDLVFDNHVTDESRTFSSNSDQFSIGGQEFSVVLSPSVRFVQLQSSPLNKVILIAGLMISAAFGISIGALLSSRTAILHQKRTESDLRISEAHHNLLVQTQSDLICRFTPEGVLNFVNDAYAEFVGKSVEDLMGQSIYEDVPEEDHQGMQVYFSKLNPDSPSASIENQNTNKLGEARTYEWINHAHFDDSGNVTEIQSVGRDVTDIRRDRDRAEAASLAKSAFLATMSHEIRTPLNGVLGLTQLLRDSDLDEDQKKKVETILSSGQTLLAIINDVLDMSKIEAGGLELEEKPFSLSSLISTITTPFQSLADEKGLKLYVSSDLPPGHVIKGDPVRLRQVLWNLLSNAIKFTDLGQIALTIKNVGPSKDGELLADAKDSVISFSIEDTGVGISQDRVDAIFDAFTQEDTSITRKYGGTGLGLSIVKQLTELMGGSISTTSELGKGTTFLVYLPFGKATDEEKEAISLRTENVSLRDTAPMNVLVAEDNEVNAAIACAFLKKFGHSVRHVENGKLAVDAIKSGWVDLILMDVHMPEMNGVDATKEIRSSEIGKNIPIIGLTAEAFAERHKQFRDAGMVDVLTKPFTEQQLADVLATNRLIDRRKTIRSDNPHLKSDGEFDAIEGDAIEPVEAFSSEVRAFHGCNEDGMNAFCQQFDAAIVSKLLVKAQEGLSARMDELHKALAASDSKQIREAAHSIKGSCGSMFAIRVSELSAVIEEKSSDLEAVSKLMPELEIAAKEASEWWRNKST